MIFSARLIQRRRTIRRRRAAEAWLRFVLPDRRLRSRAGWWLRRLFPWLGYWCGRQFGWIFFDRLIVPRYTMQHLPLRPYDMDIRQIICDQPLMNPQPYDIPYVVRTSNAPVSRDHQAHHSSLSPGGG